MPISIPYYQTDIPLESLPTMYDLPSEDPEEPGLPDTFHFYQPFLLTDTFLPPEWSPQDFYVAADVNLYYDARHPKWYKRPDWYVALGVPRLYAGKDLRLSYVVWQEKVVPFLIVEFISPGTEKEDLGRTLHEVNDIPTKWYVYEHILQVPYYVVYSRYTQELQCFKLRHQRLQRLEGVQSRLWLPEVKVGIGIWHGVYHEAESDWLRFYDEQGNWIPTPAERAEQEKQLAVQANQRAEREKQLTMQANQRAEQERQRAERLAAQLKAMGIDPDSI